MASFCFPPWLPFHIHVKAMLQESLIDTAGEKTDTHTENSNGILILLPIDSVVLSRENLGTAHTAIIT